MLSRIPNIPAPARGNTANQTNSVTIKPKYRPLIMGRRPGTIGSMTAYIQPHTRHPTMKCHSHPANGAGKPAVSATSWAIPSITVIVSSCGNHCLTSINTDKIQVATKPAAILLTNILTVFTVPPGSNINDDTDLNHTIATWIPSLLPCSRHRSLEDFLNSRYQQTERKETPINLLTARDP